MNRFLLLAGLSLVLSVLLGCKTTREGRTMPLRTQSPQFLYEKLVSQQLQAEWLSAKARIGYQDDLQRVSATATIHLRKDSLIWIAVRKLGFEVARLQITPDSIFVIDRINNEFAVEDFQYLNREFRFPANFQILQSMLLGHPLFFGLKGFSAKTGDRQYILQHEDDDMKSTYRLDGTNFLMEYMAFQEKKERRQMDITFDDYESLSGQQKFSYLRIIELSGMDLGNIQMDISFSKVEINQPQALRFSVPERYTRVR